MISTRQLDKAFTKHINAVQEAELQMVEGQDLEIVTRKALETTQSFLALLVSFREQEEAVLGK